MKKCRALIFPSIWYEGFPLTVLEAFSTGTPVISSELGAMAEIIQNGVNGLLFEAGNEDALIKKIIDIQLGPELAKRLADNARLSYLTHYTPEKNYGVLLGIYKKALVAKNEERAKLVHHPVPQLNNL
jgi:glycosyltransferase involved in cell wall biosynthesis